MEGNCLLVSLAVCYWAAFFYGFFFVIPFWLAQHEFRRILYGDEEANSCMLFAVVGRYEFAKLHGTEMNYCRISLFFPVAAMGIALVLAVLHSARAWKAVAEMDEEVKYRMWAWPWLILDFVVFLLMTLCASYTTAGLAETCDKIRRHIMPDVRWNERGQSDASRYDQPRYNSGDRRWNDWYESSQSCFTHIAAQGSMRISLTAALYLAVIAYWLLVKIWLLVTILQAIRVRRNAVERRMMEDELYFPPPTPETAL